MQKNYHKIILICALIFTIVFCVYFVFLKKDIYNKQPKIAQPGPQKFENKEYQVNLYAVGDIMVHDAQRNSAYDEKTKTYSFDSWFSSVSSIFKTGDIVIGNLETPVAGAEFGYSGYPTFNAPSELLTSLKSAGFTHLLLANNHMLDRGIKGLIKTKQHVIDAGIDVVGVKSNNLEKNYTIIHKNNITIGVLNYTYGTNGIKVPEDTSYMVPILTKENIKNDLEKLKLENPDIIILFPHWGDEYVKYNNKTQEEIAQYFCDNGGDIIVGSHPHVLQNIEYIENSIGKKCFVAYSLGNFVSGMTVNYTDLGGMLHIKIKKIEKQNNTDITYSADFVPTIVGRPGYKIMKLDSITNQDTDLYKNINQNKINLYTQFVTNNVKKYIAK